MCKHTGKDMVHIAGDRSHWMEKLLLNAAILTCTGQYQITIENYRHLQLLTETELILRTKTCQIRILGEGLKVIYYTKEVMKLTGHIQQIEYLK